MVQAIQAECFSVNAAMRMRFLANLTWTQYDSIRSLVFDIFTKKPRLCCGIPLPVLPEQRQVMSWALGISQCEKQMVIGEAVEAGVTFDLVTMAKNQILQLKSATCPVPDKIHYQVVKDGCNVRGSPLKS
jgi:hypothetical protein